MGLVIHVLLICIDKVMYGVGVCFFSGVKKVGEKKIYLLTDVGSEYSDDQIDQICTGLRTNGVDLIVM